MDGLLFLGVGLLLAVVGVFQRRGLFLAYESGRKRYTGTTPMKITHIETSTMTTWEEQEDGASRECHSTIYLPTYEYTVVDGKTYQYASRQDTCHSVGACVTSYYDHSNPKLILEDPVRPSYFSGFFFFPQGAVCLFAGGYTIFMGPSDPPPEQKVSH